VKSTVTWIVVADHQRAKVFENDGPGKGMREVPGLAFATHLHFDRDIVSDRPGRAFESSSGTPHGMEPRSDPHRLEGRRFVERVVDALDEAAKRGAFDRLVVVAPPRALGEFRQALPDRVRDKVVGELAEDLTKAPEGELPGHLGNYLAI
jgi:protein required for attachment to host cells